jgi:hypothetical protein
MSAGNMAAVLPLVSFTDRVPARTIFLVSSALNALSCFDIAFSDGLLPNFHRVFGPHASPKRLRHLRRHRDRL